MWLVDVKTISHVSIAYFFFLDMQLCANNVAITTSSNQEGNVSSRYSKDWGGKSSFGSVSLNCSSWVIWGLPVLVTSNEMWTLMFGGLSSVTSCRVITKGRLILKSFTIWYPTTDFSFLWMVAFKVKIATFKKYILNKNSAYLCRLLLFEGRALQSWKRSWKE